MQAALHRLFQVEKRLIDQPLKQYRIIMTEYKSLRLTTKLNADKENDYAHLPHTMLYSRTLVIQQKLKLYLVLIFYV